MANTALESALQDLRQEFTATIQALQQQLTGPSDQRPVAAPEPTSGDEQEEEDQQFAWADLLDLPTAPHLPPQSVTKVYRLAKEVRRRATLRRKAGTYTIYRLLSIFW